jgi:capsular polysaccharide biosynthesis protein
MQTNQILSLIKRKTTGIVLFGVFVAALSFLILVIKEKNFKVSTDYLIVQNQTGNQDFYTLSKSAEYIGKVLNEGAYSELFINEITKTGKVNAEFLPFDKKEKMKEWSKIVNVSRNADLGIISINVFDNNQNQALAISNAISDVLITKNSLFLGDGQNINVRVLSGPVMEKNPTIANIFATAISGFILGILLGALWIVLREDRRKKEIFSQPKKSLNFGAQNRMETAGNFMSEDEYRESLKYIDK